MAESLECLALVGEEDRWVESSDFGMLTGKFLAQLAQRGGFVAKEQTPDVDVRRAWWEGRGGALAQEMGKDLMLSAQVPPLFAA